jgi:hypothetical protein
VHILVVEVCKKPSHKAFKIKWFQIWNVITNVENTRHMCKFGNEVLELFTFFVVKIVFNEVPFAKKCLCDDIQVGFV